MRTRQSALGSVAGSDEGGLGVVHLARDGLHLRVRERLRVLKDGELIATKRLRREDIELNEAQTSHMHTPPRARKIAR